MTKRDAPTIRSVRPLQPGWWMSAEAWMDEDGEHVWMAHDCADRRVTSMFPHPTWRRNGDHVEPSFACADCGLHAFNVPLRHRGWRGYLPGWPLSYPCPAWCGCSR